MARTVRPKVNESWTLKSGIGEADFTVTNVTMHKDQFGPGKLVIEGYPTEQRMGMSGSITASANPYISTGLGGYTTYDPTIKAKMATPKSKGMAVDIKTVETLDGVKAQIVFTLNSKKVIAWESEAFEDDDDLDKGLDADTKAVKAAEKHAKDVLKATFK